MLLALAGCGKKGPPLPPLGRRPEAPTTLVASQWGDDLVLELRLPERRQDGSPLEAVPAVLVLRQEVGGKPELLGRMEPGVPPGGDVRAALPMAEVFRESDATRVEVLVRVQEAEGKPSPSSPAVSVTRASAPPPPPEVKVEPRGDALWIGWEAPAGAEGLRYNVHRRAEGETEWGPPLHPAPLPPGGFLDLTAALDVPYEYHVRSVVPGAEPFRQSVASPAVRAERRDLLPPGPPGEVRAVAVPEGIRVFWFPPADLDLGGFRIYRSIAGDGERRLLAELPADSRSYLDRETAPGVRYRYVVLALDAASPPNESAPSPPAEELAGPAAAPEE